MAVSVSSLCERLAAEVTGVELSFCVKIHVVLYVAELCELLCTEMASENLVASSSHAVHYTDFVVEYVFLNLLLLFLVCFLFFCDFFGFNHFFSYLKFRFRFS